MTHVGQQQHRPEVGMPPSAMHVSSQDLVEMSQMSQMHYSCGRYKEALQLCETIYSIDASRTDNLLLLGATHFQLRNFSECIFYNQQCIRVEPTFGEAYSNLGNALKELGDLQGAVQFYLKAIKLKPRFCDAYNNLALAHMQLGQPQQAIETYRMALVLAPNLVDAHCNLGNLYKAQGDLEQAKACYLQTIQIQPNFAIAWSNLAGVFKDEGQLATAIAYYREAIRLCPHFGDAYSNLGNAIKEQGNLDEAMKCYEAAIAIRPDFAIAHGNLASCYYDKGDLEQAIKLFKYAIQLEPNFPDAYNNLGNALRESSRDKLEEAIYCYRTALRLKPDHPHAYNNLGNAMKDKGMVKEAVHCYVTAARLMPRFAAAHSNLGSTLKEQGKLHQAIAHYHEAISINPRFVDAYSNMGNAYKDLGRVDDAIKCYMTAIKLQPNFADAYANVGSAYKDGGHVVEAIAYYRKALELKPNFPDAFANLVHALTFICVWSDRDEQFRHLQDILHQQLRIGMPNNTSGGGAAAAGGSGGGSAAHAVGGGGGGDAVAATLDGGRAAAGGGGATPMTPPLPSVQPFHALVYPLGLHLTHCIAQRFAARSLANVSLLSMEPFRHRAKRPEERLHVGYVSSDFGNHPLSHLMQSVFGMHDRSNIKVTCYALTPSDMSTWRKRIEGDAECLRDISQLPNEQAARLIFDDGVHVLVNLNGYTKGSRNEIFALQPAPIQVSYMGFCGSMGADFIQYMIADQIVIPPEEEFQRHYTEKIAYMPHSYFVNDHRQSSRYVLDPHDPDQHNRAHYGVPEDAFVFCNFNQLFKIDPQVFDTWCSILKRVPNSILWLLRFPPAGEANIREEARRRGVKDNQLHFTDVSPKDEHIRRGKLVELFLDTPQCNAHTTGCDILWGGTPIVTTTGDKMGTRVAASLLHAAGLDELVCADLSAYEELAVSLAVDAERYMDVRGRLEAEREESPLFDTRRWVRNLESGLHMMWQRHECGLPPDHLFVQDVVGGPLPFEPLLTPATASDEPPQQLPPDAVQAAPLPSR